MQVVNQRFLEVLKTNDPRLLAHHDQAVIVHFSGKGGGSGFVPTDAAKLGVGYQVCPFGGGLVSAGAAGK